MEYRGVYGILPALRTGMDMHFKHAIPMAWGFLGSRIAVFG